MTEMVCVSPEGRITPGCTGLWTDAQRDAWREVTAFVHARSTAKIGLQLGHSGRKGSTRLMWDGIDQPLEDGNWEVIAPLRRGLRRRLPPARARRPGPTGPGASADFVAAAERAACGRVRPDRSARGARLPALVLPVPGRQHAHRRYGGSLESPLRFPLEVFDAIRAPSAARRSRSTVRDLGHRLGARRHHRRRRGRDRRGPSSSTAPPPSTSPPARSAADEKPRSAGPTRPRSPT